MQLLSFFICFISFKLQSGSQASLELDLEHYVVPSPATCVVYPANMTETPRYLAASKYGSGTESNFSKSGGTGNQPTGVKVCYSFIYLICDPVFKVQNKSFT